MAEDAQNISKHHGTTYADNVELEVNPSTNHLNPSTEECERAVTSPSSARETMSSMHQRRQRCELRRLLKHTCPELKTIDGLVEEGLADTDTGCEVQSKRWLFENHAVSPVDFHQIKKDFQDCDIMRTSSEELMCSSPNEENKPQSQTPLNEPGEVTSEQNIRVDVKATRRMFEIQSIESQSPCPRKNVFFEEQSRSGQKLKNDSETCFGEQTSDNHSINLPNDMNFKDTNEIFVGISTAEENISTTSDRFSKEEEILKANVRNRAQMFESTPLDKINQQTKEESETMLENMQDILISLWKFKIIQADGSILEVSTNGHVRRARYAFINDSRPEVHGEEIVTGSIKNIMLQMLPGTNLNPTVTFLKEDSQGNVEIHKVDVPTHQLPFNVLQDKDCRIAHVVQITEDLLSQEKSLRKGVLIQDGVTETKEITVYALFGHNEDSIMRVVEFEKMECRSISSSQTKILEPQKEDIKKDISCASGVMRDSSSEINLEANKIVNVQLVRGSIEKGDTDHLKHLQKPSSDIDMSASTEPSEKTSEIISGNVKSIRALFSSILDETSLLLQSTTESKESKLSSKESGMKSKNDTNEPNKTKEPMQPKSKIYCETDEKIERILPSEDLKGNEAVLQAELVDAVEDDAGPSNHELIEINRDSKLIENIEPPQISNVEEESEDVMRGSIQAALNSLGKSNFNVTTGDFRAAMIYKNSGKGYAGHKKVTGMEPPSDGVVENKTEPSCSGLLGEEQVFPAPVEEVDTAPCLKPSENKPLRNQMHVSTDAPIKKSKTTTGPKPAIPPKPDQLKIKTNPNATVDGPLQGEGQATRSKPANEENKQLSSCPYSCPDPMSSVDAFCNLQHSGDAHESKPNDMSMIVKGNEGSTHATLNSTQVLEESPKSSPESLQNMSESTTGFHTTLQNFGVKAGGLVAPVKPKRIKMAKDFSEHTNNNSAVQQSENTAQPNGASPQNDGTSSGTYKAETNHKCEDQQKSEVVRREKKIRRETEDEKRQRLSVHMDEIMKGNVTAVIEIFDKLKKQEELKNILSKVEEMQEESSEVDVKSLKNMFEKVPDWVEPQEKKTNPISVFPEHTRGASETLEPEMMSSMQMAFGDLEKAGAEIIRLKEQTLAKLMDIEEAIKKALYSVSTLKSDSDIVGLSGLFRESMVAVQGSSTSGNIRKISIGSSKSPKVQNIHSTIPEHSKPGLGLPTAKQRSSSPASPSFISIQSAARKREEPSQISPQKAETKLQCCCNMSPDRRQCAVTKEASTSPANQRRQISVLELRTAPEEQRVIGTRTISENYERRDYFGNKFYSSKTSTVVTTQPETRTTSKKLITACPATSEMITYPRINML